jgi:predicted secreted protein
MRNRVRIALVIFALTAHAAFAGDVATFVNLGFSSDSSIFMFAQYGIDGETSHPYAELYTVDVPENSFVRGGVHTRSFDVEPQPGQDGRGALYTVLEQQREQVSEYGVDHLQQGRLIYLLVNGEEPKSEISFRDFNTGNRFHVNLKQTAQGEGEDARASFHIQLSVNLADGGVEAHTVGRPGYQREGVLNYVIREIILAPDGRSLVFVVEKTEQAEEGSNIRYMVETVRFR